MAARSLGATRADCFPLTLFRILLDGLRTWSKALLFSRIRYEKRARLVICIKRVTPVAGGSLGGDILIKIGEIYQKKVTTY